LLGELSPQERAAIVLKEVFDMSLEEIADSLATSVGAALLLETGSVEVAFATTQYGCEAARRTVLWGMLFGVKRMATADVNGGIEARFIQACSPSLLGSRRALIAANGSSCTGIGTPTVTTSRAITRVQIEGDSIARLVNHFFDPDAVADATRRARRAVPLERIPLVPSEVLVITLYYHPLSSFCMKVLIGLYELGVPHEKHLVDFSDPAQRRAFDAMWPIGKFPLIRDEGRVVVESSIILEHIDDGRLHTNDLQARFRDRVFDSYIHQPMQKVVTDTFRPEGKHDPFGVAEARTQIETAYAVVEEWIRDGRWGLGDAFSVVDCSAAPALFYANKVVPLGDRPLARYLERLSQRPSFARVLAEAAPYLAMFPG
jgi:glutathione S-transferase